MIEIYKNSPTRTISITAPVTPLPGTVEVSVYESGVLVHTVQTVTVNNNTYSVVMPFSLIQNDRDLVVKWKFRYEEPGSTPLVQVFEQTTHVAVVTPILPFTTIRSILDDNASDDEVMEIERAVRTIIQAHTGQSFGKYVGKRAVTGNGDKALRLPMRLLRLNSINGERYMLPNLIVRGDGWYIIHKSFGIPSLKADYHGLHYLNNGVIEAPSRVPRMAWVENVDYVIDGEWGWEQVPTAVEEAARLLMNDYACQDVAYRDRYLDSISMADWKLQFNQRAFEATGNARADQLLSNYVLKRGWAVV